MRIRTSPPEELQGGVPIVAFDHDALGQPCGYCGCSLSGHFVEAQDTGTIIWCRDCGATTFTDSQHDQNPWALPA